MHADRRLDWSGLRQSGTADKRRGDSGRDACPSEFPKPRLKAVANTAVRSRCGRARCILGMRTVTVLGGIQETASWFAALAMLASGAALVRWGEDPHQGRTRRHVETDDQYTPAANKRTSEQVRSQSGCTNRVIALALWPYGPKAARFRYSSARPASASTSGRTDSRMWPRFHPHGH